jgi:quercetin dioxygenase-like cupin family protein
MKPTVLLIAACAALFCTASAANASEKLGYPAHELLTTTTDVLDQPIQYPAGQAKITSAIITIQPGAEGQLHVHEVPMYAYVLQGTITVDYGARGTKVFTEGDAIMEAQHLPHKGMNKGTGPVALLVVYMGAEGMANATPVK